MSTITNVVLHTSILEEDEDVSVFLKDLFGRDNQPPPVYLDSRKLMPQHKALECEVWVGAYNGLNLPMIVKGLGERAWEEPQAVQLFVQMQEHEQFYLAYGTIETLTLEQMQE